MLIYEPFRSLRAKFIRQKGKILCGIKDFNVSRWKLDSGVSMRQHNGAQRQLHHAAEGGPRRHYTTLADVIIQKFSLRFLSEKSRCDGPRERGKGQQRASERRLKLFVEMEKVCALRQRQ